MKIPVSKIVRAMIPFFALIALFSCSKDSDLLADYVVADYQQSKLIGNLVADDYYFIANKKSLVLDVLSNDIFEDPENVKIIEVSTPNNGTITINEDKTLTYTVGIEVPIGDTNENSETVSQEQTSEQEQGSEQTETSVENQDSEQDTEANLNTEEEDAEETQNNNSEVPEVDTDQHDDTPKDNSTVETETDEEKQEAVEETITYTVETENEDGTTDNQEGTVTITNDYGELKAFPTADGYGKYTTGGRGGYVVHVTNLNDSGPGSLRAAIYAKGKRTVVFDVSGYINLEQTLSIRNPNITIAGQTAPGGGVTITGANIAVRASNVIIRHLRIRPGYNAAKGSECINVLANQDNLNIDGVIIDHCSLSWSTDENMAFDANSSFSNNSIKNVTVQNCLNAEALNYYAVLMGRNLSRVSLIKNVFANNQNRIPESSYGYTPESYEFVNNIIYNYNRPTKLVYGVEVDIIGNIYKTKETPAVPNLQYGRNKISNPDGKPSDGKIFSIDNIQIGHNPKGMMNSIWAENVRSSRVLTDSPYSPYSANNLENVLLSDVGARAFDDPVDSRIIREYLNNGGIRGPRHESEVGGYPNLPEERHPYNYDRDGDGMSDQWELDNGLDPNDSTDGNGDSNEDGYTNLEDFLHQLTLR